MRRHADRKLEAQLRAARREPSAELTQAITDRVRPRRSFMGSLARVPLAPVGGLTAIVVAVALALAATSPQLDLGTPAVHQYGHETVTICYGDETVEVAESTAETLVELGVAEYGPCLEDILNPPG